jgi:hypothetical protein
MAFKLKKATEEKKHDIVITLVVDVLYEDKNADGVDIAPETETVIHYMRIPERSEREKHQQMQVKVRGQNIKSMGTAAANFYLWSVCFTKLEGYEDLPPTREQIIKMFEEDVILHIHAENAAQALLNKITASEDDTEKK